MIAYLKLLRVLYGDRRGVTALEYALIAGVLATVLVTAFTTLGTDLSTALTKLAASIPGA
ncbi:MAG: Flp family type IVb pilin [Rhodospirillales bacterium]|jgi:pilus assembly protein Flp/PilA|nr:Flp family type IVb pilin [Rhodospirillales bacterium]